MHQTLQVPCFPASKFASGKWWAYLAEREFEEIKDKGKALIFVYLQRHSPIPIAIDWANFQPQFVWQDTSFNLLAPWWLYMTIQRCRFLAANLLIQSFWQFLGLFTYILSICVSKIRSLPIKLWTLYNVHCAFFRIIFNSAKNV